VSNLEPGEDGFTINQAIELLHSIRGMNVIGGDVVCLMPSKDSPNQITAMRAAAIMFEMIALIGENKINTKSSN
jgi:guanidinopropionase